MLEIFTNLEERWPCQRIKKYKEINQNQISLRFNIMIISNHTENSTTNDISTVLRNIQINKRKHDIFTFHREMSLVHIFLLQNITIKP